MRLVVGVSMLVFLAACETAPPPTVTAKPPAAPSAAAKPQAQLASAKATDPEKKICKQMPVMGSNMPQRVCSTKAEWDAFDKKGQKSVDDYNQVRNSMGAPTEAERPRN